MEGEKFYMIDAHVHLEKGDYSVKWIEQFIEYAVKRNIRDVLTRKCWLIYERNERLDSICIIECYK